MTRIVLVDDQPLLRVGFGMVLDHQDDLEVVGEAADGEEALALVEELAPDVVLMDIRMPVLDGVEATRRIVESGSEARVIILTTFDLDEYVYAALRAGASGFLLKDAAPAELLAAIRSVAAGDAVVAPSATRRLLERFGDHLPVAPALDGNGNPLALTLDADGNPLRAARPELSVPAAVNELTAREREVLLAVAAGQSNAEIAGELFMAEATVKTHIGRILAKLELRDRVQIVVYAYEHRLVRPTS